MSDTVKKRHESINIPVLPLRGIVVFPETIIHFDVGRDRSIHALDAAMNKDQQLFLITQKDPQTDEPEREDLYNIGTLGTIKQILKLPGDRMRVLVEGKARARLMDLQSTDSCLMGDITVLRTTKAGDTIETRALVRSVCDALDNYAKISGRISPDTLAAILSIDDPGQLADILAANLLEKQEEKQQILEMLKDEARLSKVFSLLLRETEIAEAEKSVQAQVREQMEQNQRDYYLREQIKAIQTELGDDDEAQKEDLRERIKNTPMNDEARDKANRELEKLERMSPGSPEIGLSESYIEWLLALPWGKYTHDQYELNRARRILEEDHYGLQDVKERIIEYLAICRIRQDIHGPILCFVGPPGVGKTSIAKSIARALGRRFVQMSLGGVRDEAEIRG
ncbi:MAG: LON peptidase substrate-binding domain-containing protein, partial [Clostridia bacterium]|nr:LON peptidase substrate-binding domain-containing protein [Clostridia bacterium]